MAHRILSQLFPKKQKTRHNDVIQSYIDLKQHAEKLEASLKKVKHENVFLKQTLAQQSKNISKNSHNVFPLMSVNG